MKHIKIYSLLVLVIFLSLAAKKVLVSNVYTWENARVKKSSSGEVRTYFASPTRYLDMFGVEAVTLYPGKKTPGYKVEKGGDEMIIIKEGVAEIHVNDVQKTLGEGSVVVASPGDEITVLNNQNSNLVYYSFIMKPHQPETANTAETSIAPLFVDWKQVKFKPSETGGRRDILKQATTSLRELEIHVTTLKEGVSSHAGHSHPDEEFVLVRYGNVEMDLDGNHYKGGPGALFFLASEGTHSLVNTGNSACEYFAIRWFTKEQPKN